LLLEHVIRDRGLQATIEIKHQQRVSDIKSRFSADGKFFGALYLMFRVFSKSSSTFGSKTFRF